MSQSGELDPNAAQPPADPAEVPARPPRSLLRPFNRAGAPSIADLGFDAQPDNDDDDRSGTNPADLIGFPGERMPHISFGFEGERWRIRNVVWVIGQSPTGLALIEHTYRAGYRIGFDGMVITGERLNYACNLQDRVIVLDTRATPEQQVNQLAYLYALGSAAIDGVSYDISLSPPAALKANRLANAYAVALQLQIMHELRQSTTLPASADKDAYWRLAEQAHPRLARTYAQAAVNDIALKQGSAMAMVLRDFYAQRDIKERYDTEVIKFYNSLSPATFKDAKLMNLGFDPTALAYKMNFQAPSYAVSHDPKLDLNDTMLNSVTPLIGEAIEKLYTTRRNAGVKDREPWHVNIV